MKSLIQEVSRKQYLTEKEAIKKGNEMLNYKNTCPNCKCSTSTKRISTIYDRIGFLKRQYWDLYSCNECGCDYEVPVYSDKYINIGYPTGQRMPQMDKEIVISNKGECK